MEQFLQDGMRYLRPKSLTWWSGVGLIALGIYSRSADMIGIGLGMIGMRDALYRVQLS